MNIYGNLIDQLLIALNFFKENPKADKYQPEALTKDDFYLLADITILEFRKDEYFTREDLKGFTLDNYEGLLTQIKASLVTSDIPENLKILAEDYEKYEQAIKTADKSDDIKSFTSLQARLEKQQQIYRTRSEILNRLEFEENGVKANLQDEARAREEIHRNEKAFERAVARRVVEIARLSPVQAAQQAERFIKTSDIERQITEAVTASADEKLTPKAKAKISELTREYVRKGVMTIDPATVVTEVRLEEPVYLEPETKTQAATPIVLSPESVKILKDNIDRATANPQVYQKELEKVVMQELNQVQEIKKDLNETARLNKAREYSIDTTFRLLELGKQTGGLDQIIPAHNPLPILKTLANPKTDLYKDYPTKVAQKFASESAQLATAVAVDTDLRNQGLSFFPEEMKVVLWGDERVVYLPSQENRGTNAVSIDLNNLQQLYDNFFGKVNKPVQVISDEYISTFLPSFNPIVIPASVSEATAPSALASTKAISPFSWDATLELINYYHGLGISVSPIDVIGFRGLSAGFPINMQLADPLVSSFAQLPVEAFLSGSVTSGFGTIIGLEGAEVGLGAITATAVGGTELAIIPLITPRVEVNTNINISKPVTNYVFGGLKSFINKIGSFLNVKILKNATEIVGYGGVGGLVGGLVAGPAGALVGGATGAVYGASDKEDFRTEIELGLRVVKRILLTIVSEISIPLIITFIGVPIVVTLIIFIINAGAYVVPSGVGGFGPGNGPGGVACFVFQGTWPDNFKKVEIQALNDLNSFSSRYAALLCPPGRTIPLIYGGPNGGEGGLANSPPGTIQLFDAGLGAGLHGALYTIAHESGHIVEHYNGALFRQWSDSVPYTSPLGEPMLPCTYPFKPNPVGKYFAEVEGMAESIALYVLGNTIKDACMGGQSLQQKYPINWQFLNSNVF